MGKGGSGRAEMRAAQGALGVRQFGVFSPMCLEGCADFLFLQNGR
jgi:acetyl-CoA carboxylase alpha subunit